MRNDIELGASLYVPTSHRDLVQIAQRLKLSDMRSLIFCTEDAVNQEYLPSALVNLQQAMPKLETVPGQTRFVRVRNPQVMKQVLAMPGVDRLDGFVLPKVTRNVLPQYLDLLKGHHHCIMPTLETKEVFDEREMIALREMLEGEDVAPRVLTLRIGGNDLLSLLGMRRPRGKTLYQTPLGQVIARLVTTFKPSGFNLSAPVFEYLEDRETLLREVAEDMDHGLVGKTAVHPDQVPQIESCYRVHAHDLEMADRILAHDAPAVFKMFGSMCEPSTHRNWAQRLRNSAIYFGMREATVASSPINGREEFTHLIM